jgi:signal peptidase
LPEKNKESKKKDIKVILIIAIIFVVAFISIRIFLADTNPFYVVASGSMIPVLNVNDLIIVWGKDSSTSFDNAHVNDIIVFKAPDPSEENKTIVHRVAQIYQDPEGSKIIRTKGDANPYSIPGIDFPITQENYVGKVVYTVPQIGIIPQLLKPPVNYIIMAIIAGLLIFSFKRGSKKEEEKLKDE